MSELNSAVGILLAAGAGSRYGMPKVLADQGDWLHRGITALADGGCDEVLVVLGAAIVEVPDPARAVIADDWSEGMSASVRAGLAAAEGQYAVLHVVDTPDVGPDVVARLLAAARESESGVARAVFNSRPGHPVVIARSHWPAVAAVLHGDRGAREFLAARSDVVAVECADLATGVDIDTR